MNSPAPVTGWLPRLSVKRRRLGARLALTAGLSALLASFLLVAVLLLVDYRHALITLDAELDQIAERDAQQIAAAQWSFDTNTVTEMMRGVLAYPYIRRIELLDSGKLFFAEGNTPLDARMRSIDLRLEREGRSIDMGRLIVYADLASLRHELLTTYSWRFASSLIVLFVAMGFTLLLFDRQVTRHLRRLANFVGALRPDSLEQTLTLDRVQQAGPDDELGTLVSGISAMQQTMLANIRSLEESLERQRHAEEAVRQLNATLEAKVAERTHELQVERDWADHVMELTHSGYYERELNSGIFRVNRHLQQLMEFPDAPALTYRLREDLFERLLAADPAAAMKIAERMQRNDAGVQINDEIEFPLKTPVTGQIKWFRMRQWKGISDADANMVAGALQEITAEVQAREQIERARDEAEAANRAKSEFLANMSHEIRTPLNGMVGMVQLLERSGLDQRQSGYISKLRYSADVLLGVINDILDFSKIEAGQLKIEQIAFNVGETLENAVAMLRVRAEQKGLVVRLELDSKLPPMLRGDPLRLSQILTNLGNNAIKFTDAGRVLVTVHCDDAENDQVLMRCEIEDTGIGLTQEETERLFRSFAQADGSISRRYGGTGLGLAICKRLVELMGGSISVSSEPGVGSVFSFSLTLGRVSVAEVATVRQRVARPRVAVPLRGCSILLVDDNAINREVAGEMLTVAGASVVFAADGAEAIEKIGMARNSSAPFDAVLMDIQMPVMDGLTATGVLRQDPVNAELPIIAMTAHGLSGDRERSLQAGMNDHVTKPIEFDAMIDILLHWVHGTEGIGDATPEPAITPQVTLALPDTELIRTTQALARINGNLSIYRRMLVRFLDEPADFATTYRAATNLTETAALAHRLKGTAGTLGFATLWALVNEQEQCALRGEALTDAAIDELASVLAATRAAAAELLLVMPDTTAQPAETPVVADACSLAQEVREYLQRFARPPTAMTDALMVAMEAHGQTAKTFSERLAAFDFAGAAAVLDEISWEKIQ